SLLLLPFAMHIPKSGIEIYYIYLFILQYVYFFLLMCFYYSDFYNIVNEQRDLIAVLSMLDLKLPSLELPNLIENYGISSLVLSMALQRYISLFIFLYCSFKFNFFDVWQTRRS